MKKCMECGKKLGIIEGYRHPVMGKDCLLCRNCFDTVSASVEKWREFISPYIGFFKKESSLFWDSLHDELRFESDRAILTVNMPKSKVSNKFIKNAIFEDLSYTNVDDDHESPETHLYFDTVNGEVTLIGINYPLDSPYAVRAIYYKLDSGNFEVYTSPFILPEGTHTVYFYSENIQGDKEKIKSKTLTFDTTPTTVRITSPEEGFLYLLTDLKTNRSLPNPSHLNFQENHPILYQIFQQFFNF